MLDFRSTNFWMQLRRSFFRSWLWLVCNRCYSELNRLLALSTLSLKIKGTMVSRPKPGNQRSVIEVLTY